MKVDRVYHHFEKWEDRAYGMYDSTCFLDAQKMEEDCASLLKCPQWLFQTMVFVSYHWKYASEQNLTNTHRNRQAWLGQAACCIDHGAPEYITKKAWNTLNEAEMKAANGVADQVIKMWEECYLRGGHRWQK